MFTIDNDEIKIEKISSLDREIMLVLGITIDADNEKTPKRVAKMLLDIFENVGKDSAEELLPIISLFPAKDSRAVTVKDIPIVSYCSHHHLPFIGKASISYSPDKYVIGLSKIPRIIKWFCRKPQLQEYLTNEIAEFLIEILDPIHLNVRIYDCVHTCMLCRGVESEGTTDTHFSYYKE